jgi:hypothetical protein
VSAVPVSEDGDKGNCNEGKPPMVNDLLLPVLYLAALGVVAVMLMFGIPLALALVR